MYRKHVGRRNIFRFYTLCFNTRVIFHTAKNITCFIFHKCHFNDTKKKTYFQYNSPLMFTNYGWSRRCVCDGCRLKLFSIRPSVSNFYFSRELSLSCFWLELWRIENGRFFRFLCLFFRRWTRLKTVPTFHPILSWFFKVLLPLFVRFLTLLFVNFRFPFSLSLFHIASIQLLSTSFHVSEELRARRQSLKYLIIIVTLHTH